MSSKSFIEDEEHFNVSEFLIYCPQFFKPVCVFGSMSGVLFLGKSNLKKKLNKMRMTKKITPLASALEKPSY